MKLTYVPLLQVQRDLYRIPRGWERFHAYIATMVDPQSRELRFPPSGMNPMGKDHVPALLDNFNALNADDIGAEAMSEAARQLRDVQGEFRVTTVIVDDLKGGWTSRYAAESTSRFGSKPLDRRGWIVATLWTSEPASAERMREHVLLAIFRAAYIRQHGYAETLADRLHQEGYAMSAAGSALTETDIERTRSIIDPHLRSTEMGTTVACLFGDVAVESLGFTPLGLSSGAGLQLALYDALAVAPASSRPVRGLPARRQDAGEPAAKMAALRSKKP